MRDTRDLIDQLEQRFRAARARTGVEVLLETMAGTCRAPEYWRAAIRSARQEVRVLADPQPVHASVYPKPAEADLLVRGGAIRVVYDQSGVR